MTPTLTVPPAIGLIAAKLRLEEWSVVGRVQALTNWIGSLDLDARRALTLKAIEDALAIEGLAAAFVAMNWLKVDAGGTVTFQPRPMICTNCERERTQEAHRHRERRARNRQAKDTGQHVSPMRTGYAYGVRARGTGFPPAHENPLSSRPPIPQDLSNTPFPGFAFGDDGASRPLDP